MYKEGPTRILVTMKVPERIGLQFEDERDKREDPADDVLVRVLGKVLDLVEIRLKGGRVLVDRLVEGGRLEVVVLKCVGFRSV